MQVSQVEGKHWQGELNKFEHGTSCPPDHTPCLEVSRPLRRAYMLLSPPISAARHRSQLASLAERGPSNAGSLGLCLALNQGNKQYISHVARPLLEAPRGSREGLQRHGDRYMSLPTLGQSDIGISEFHLQSCNYTKTRKTQNACA